MRVDSKNIEFGEELIAVIPYAYYHYIQGNLTSTVSGVGSEAFYYFSPHHAINKKKRNCNYSNHKVPNRRVWLFNGRGEWLAPPYKEYYKNDKFVYDKPILVVANKYNLEWFRDPVNYLDLGTLRKIFDLHPNHEIFYNRKMPDTLLDDQGIMDLHEYDTIKKDYPHVHLLHELPGDYNLNQLMVYANCDKFISVQGGNSILASYFGGKNYIYAVKGKELECGFYYRLDKLSGCQVIHVRSYSELIRYLNK